VKEKNEFPTMSRKDHNKKSDHPKGGKFWAALLGALTNPAVQTVMNIAGTASNQGQQAEQSVEEKSRARMRAGMK
jgi:hypothetical protein